MSTAEAIEPGKINRLALACSAGGTRNTKTYDRFHCRDFFKKLRLCACGERFAIAEILIRPDQVVLVIPPGAKKFRRFINRLAAMWAKDNDDGRQGDVAERNDDTDMGRRQLP